MNIIKKSLVNLITAMMILLPVISQAGNYLIVTFTSAIDVNGFNFQAPGMGTDLPYRFSFSANQSKSYTFHDSTTKQDSYSRLSLYKNNSNERICDIEITPAYWNRHVRRIEITPHNNSEGRYCRLEWDGTDPRVGIH